MTDFRDQAYRTPRRLWPITLLIAMAIGGGCNNTLAFNTKYATSRRAARGAVIILPGVGGNDAACRDIRQGLYDGGVPYALVVYNWGVPVPGIGMVINQANLLGNRLAGKRLAERIVEYQRTHPGRPVFLLGYSAGGGIAVFAAEALGEVPGAKPVTGAILLSASLSADYKLDKALERIERGLVNFYDPNDTIYLFAGTTLVGNVDGGHGAAAGRTGFKRDYPNVFDRKVMAAEMGIVAMPHVVTSRADLVSRLTPPWIMNATWPPYSSKP